MSTQNWLIRWHADLLMGEMLSGSATDVVAALIRREGQLLICRRAGQGALAGLWEFPGGKVDPGETPPEALARELHEELGVEARVGPLVFEHTHVYSPDWAAHLLFYETEITAGTPQPLDHQEIRWVEPTALGDFEFVAGDGPIVAALARGDL